MARTALLIGGGGTTGVLLAQGMAEQGFDVTIMNRGTSRPPELEVFPAIRCDPHFAETVEQALGDRRFDVVIATYGRIKELAKVFGGRCERFIAVGGIPIYAGYLDPGSTHPTGQKLLSTEADPLAEPGAMGREGASKFAFKMRDAEDAVMAQHASGGFAASVFRYPVVYGPKSISPSDWSVIKRVRDKRPFILLPDDGLGIYTRCAAANTAHAMLLSIDQPKAHGHIFNIGDDDQYTLGQWTELMLGMLGSEMEIVGLPRRLNWVASTLIPLAGTCTPHCILDNSKARDLLGYTDVISARDAMRELIEWRLANIPDPEISPHPWYDQFDYALEDEIKRRLDRFIEDSRDIEQVREAVHPYPHPREPSLGRDHRGR